MDFTYLLQRQRSFTPKLLESLLGKTFKHLGPNLFIAIIVIVIAIIIIIIIRTIIFAIIITTIMHLLRVSMQCGLLVTTFAQAHQI